MLILLCIVTFITAFSNILIELFDIWITLQQHDTRPRVPTMFLPYRHITGASTHEMSCFPFQGIIINLFLVSYQMLGEFVGKLCDDIKHSILAFWDVWIMSLLRHIVSDFKTALR